MPPQKALIWNYFDCKSNANQTGKLAICKKCKRVMQGQLDRLTKHHQNCSGKIEELISGSYSADPSASSRAGVDFPLLKKRKMVATSSKIGLFQDEIPIQKSKNCSLEISRQIARSFYATNTPFSHADHKEYVKMFELLRPGYKPPSALQLGGELLNETYQHIFEYSKQQFQGQTVSMSLDGWSNIHNEPMLSLSITNQFGENVLVETIDASNISNTSEYFEVLRLEAIVKCEEVYPVTIGSFVSDYTGYIKKLCRTLENNKSVDVLQYRCSAHVLNLLAKDVKIPNLDCHIIKIVEYFRNTHLPAEWYKTVGGTELVMPINIRWNTLNDTIRSYLNNRRFLVQTCQEHQSEIDGDILRLVNDVNLSNNAQHYLNRMIPIVAALDRMQGCQTTIAVAVEVWYKLEHDLDVQDKFIIEKFKNRKRMALGATHFLANMLDHRFRGFHLSDAEKALSYELITEIHKDFAPLLMAYYAADKPFPQYLFGQHFRKVNPITWWKSVSTESTELDWGKLNGKWMQMCNKFLTAVAANSDQQHMFSTFGLVQSKLRNGIGKEKATKLTFMFKYMNKNDKKTNLEWLRLEEQNGNGTCSENRARPLEIKFDTVRNDWDNKMSEYPVIIDWS